MSSEVFLISTAQEAEPTSAVRRAAEAAEIEPARIQDVILGSNRAMDVSLVTDVVRDAGLNCQASAAWPTMRAVLFTAGSVAGGELEVAVVLDMGESGATALLLAATEAVGRWNLMPRARLAARSAQGLPTALREAGITESDVAIFAETRQLQDISRALDELEKQQQRWVVLTAGPLALILERT